MRLRLSIKNSRIPKKRSHWIFLYGPFGVPRNLPNLIPETSYNWAKYIRQLPGRIFWIMKENPKQSKKASKTKKQRSEFGGEKVPGSCGAKKETRKEAASGREERGGGGKMERTVGRRNKKKKMHKKSSRNLHKFL